MSIGLLLMMFANGVADGSPPVLATQNRRPVALVLADDGHRLYVANRNSGTISVIDTETRKVVAEPKIGQKLADLSGSPDGRYLFAINPSENRLILLRGAGANLDIQGFVEVAPDPVRLSVAREGSRVAVASRWSNRVTIVDVSVSDNDANRRLSLTRTIALPFAPRHLIWLDNANNLVVADAFGGRIAVVNADRGTVESTRNLAAHNIGGLAYGLDRKRLIITQQFLNHRSETTADSIHWGFLLTNSLRSLKVDDLFKPDADLVASSRLAHLGEPGNGAGDPAGFVVMPDGQIVTALAGVGQIAVGRLEAPDRQRISVGARPMAVAANSDGSLVYVANTLDDSISVVDLRTRALTTISLGPVPPQHEVDLGERLFHDARLSHEGWMSCQSCHGEGHTNGRLADTLGDGSFGDPKEVLSLLGVADTAPYAWNGGVPDLAGQVRKSIKTTMRSQEQTEVQVRALTAYLQTLPPPPPPLITDLDDTALTRGRLLFENRRCDRCHKPPLYTTPKSYDVGMTDESGNAFFNPPSLRGVARRSPYFHDGRARKLGDVFTRFGHPQGAVYTDQQVQDLSEFLRSL